MTDRAMKTHAAPRGTHFALCIGNSEYSQLNALPNAAHDAEDMAALCRSLGFQTELLRDAGRIDMVDAARAFAERLKAARASVSLFFYAGARKHRLQDSSQTPPRADTLRRGCRA